MNLNALSVLWDSCVTQCLQKYLAHDKFEEQPDGGSDHPACQSEEDEEDIAVGEGNRLEPATDRVTGRRPGEAEPLVAQLLHHAVLLQLGDVIVEEETELRPLLQADPVLPLPRVFDLEGGEPGGNSTLFCPSPFLLERVS